MREFTVTSERLGLDLGTVIKEEDLGSANADALVEGGHLRENKGLVHNEPIPTAIPDPED